MNPHHAKMADAVAEKPKHKPEGDGGSEMEAPEPHMAMSDMDGDEAPEMMTCPHCGQSFMDHEGRGGGQMAAEHPMHPAHAAAMPHMMQGY
jgi:hypothetical protein